MRITILLLFFCSAVMMAQGRSYLEIEIDQRLNRSKVDFVIVHSNTKHIAKKSDENTYRIDSISSVVDSIEIVIGYKKNTYFFSSISLGQLNTRWKFFVKRKCLLYSYYRLLSSPTLPEFSKKGVISQSPVLYSDLRVDPVLISHFELLLLGKIKEKFNEDYTNEIKEQIE